MGRTQKGQLCFGVTQDCTWSRVVGAAILKSLQSYFDLFVARGFVPQRPAIFFTCLVHIVGLTLNQGFEPLVDCDNWS